MLRARRVGLALCLLRRHAQVPLHPHYVANLCLLTLSLHSETLEAEVTHVVVDMADPTRLDAIQEHVARYRRSHRVCHVVSKEWVEESAAAHDDLDEREFYVLGEQFHNYFSNLAESP